jgi:hypothetical protein
MAAPLTPAKRPRSSGSLRELIKEVNFCGVRLQEVRMVDQEPLYRWHDVKKGFHVQYRKRSTYFKTRGWGLGKDFRLDYEVFQDKKRSSHAQPVWVPLRCVLQVALAEAPATGFSNQVVKAAREVRYDCQAGPGALIQGLTCAGTPTHRAPSAAHGERRQNLDCQRDGRGGTALPCRQRDRGAK